MANVTDEWMEHEVEVFGPDNSPYNHTLWRNRSNEVKNRDGKCMNCNSIKELRAHHRQYHYLLVKNGKEERPLKVLPWLYADEYLITLCKTCHEAGHKLYRIPLYHLRKLTRN